MADRDINIPFGPDRTGEFDLSSVIPEVNPVQPDPNPEPELAASPVADADLGQTIRFDPRSAQYTQALPNAADALSDEAFEAAPQRDYAQLPSDFQEEGALIGGSPEAAFADAGTPADAAPETEDAGAMPLELDDIEAPGDATAAPKMDVQASLAALKASIDQGRELKAREKERQEFGERLDADREELADREDILANYQVLVAEQDAIIDQNTQQRDARKAELSQCLADQEATSDELQRMRDFHDSQMQPYETALGRAKAEAEQAKNDERSRKSELNAAEAESRKAEGGDDAAMAQARLEVVQQAYEEASARSESAKEALAQIQQHYDDQREQFEQAEAPLERSLEDLEKQIGELKESVARLGDTISAARKRRQYCDTVYQYPDETAKLRESVAADEVTARRMDEENDELREQLAESKQRSKIAKLAIGAVIILILVIIIAFVVVGGR